MIRLKLCSIFVNDQEKALDFYINKLGFIKKADEPIGAHRWLTVGLENEDLELVLEPDAHPAARATQPSDLQ